MPRIYLVGNAHIDPIWLWRWSEGQQVIRSTFWSQVNLLKEKQDYVFCASSALFYKVIEQTSPMLFEEIKRMIKEGRWEIVGGWWVEPDCNLPSGESFARHSLYGQRYFTCKFGVRAKVGYNIDSFGHNAMMPQLLRKSGMGYYIFMRPGSHEMELPFSAFNWSSPDGSAVTAVRIPTYIATGQRLKSLIETEIEEQKSPTESSILFIGQGDHGGGPTAQDIRDIDRLRDEIKPIELKFTTLDHYFSEIDGVKEHLPTVADELQHHASGCYSALSKVKQLNRKAEEALIAAEKFSFMGSLLAGVEYHSEELYRAWTNLLFCQFHDVLSGTCLKEAYEGDVFPMLEEAISIANRITELSTQSLASGIPIRKDKSIIMFNSNAFAVKYPVEVNWPGSEHPAYLSDQEGSHVECQVVKGSALAPGSSILMFIADVPGLGYGVLEPLAAAGSSRDKEELRIEEFSLENRYLRMELNRSDGSISRFILKDGSRVMLTDAATAIVIDDKSDTWAHGVFKFDNVIGQFSCEKMEIVEQGPVRGTVRARYKFGDSTIRQDFILYRDLDYLVCKVDIDWHEKRKMLKLCFPVMASQPEAVFEIPYGLVKRPTNGEEEPGLRWVDVSGDTESNAAFGVTLINDSKYSYDVNGNIARITVLRSPAFAHHDPTELEPISDPEYVDQGRQSFTYILRPHRGPLKPWEASKIADALLAPPVAIMESEHGGNLPTKISLVRVSEESIILKVVKRSEGLDDWVLRLYETSGKHVKTEISLPALGLTFEADFEPYEIKTYSVSAEAKTARETDITEEWTEVENR